MNNPVTLGVQRWNAWLPGIQGEDACRAWARGECQPDPDAAPDVSCIPPMLRRRLSPVGRAAAAVLWDLLEPDSQVPLVFCSRHGDQDKTLQLLAAIGQQEPLSPAAFSVSVHNAVAGLLSIAKNARGPHTALSAQDLPFTMGALEAWAQLRAGAERVLLVVYDYPLPAVYQYPEPPAPPFALALELSLAGADLQLMPASGPGVTPDPVEPLHWLRWWLAGDAALQLNGQQGAWLWRR